MLRLQKHARPLTAITVATVVALAAFVPSIVSADRSTPAPSAAAKKKKKKWPPLTATVNGSLTVRENFPGGFGHDDGPSWQQLKIVIKDAKIPFRAPNRGSASASVSVHIVYESEAHTQDYWGPGGSCDRADYKQYGVWGGKTRVNILRAYNLTTNGKINAYRGWEVFALLPATGIYTATEGSYQELDPQDNCVTVEDNKPGRFMWPQQSSSFISPPEGLGKLSSDGRSVRLTEISTSVNQIGSVSGSIKFNTPVER